MNKNVKTISLKIFELINDQKSITVDSIAEVVNRALLESPSKKIFTYDEFETELENLFEEIGVQDYTNKEIIVWVNSMFNFNEEYKQKNHSLYLLTEEIKTLVRNHMQIKNPDFTFILLLALDAIYDNMVVKFLPACFKYKRLSEMYNNGVNTDVLVQLANSIKTKYLLPDWIEFFTLGVKKETLEKAIKDSLLYFNNTWKLKEIEDEDIKKGLCLIVESQLENKSFPHLSRFAIDKINNFKCILVSEDKTIEFSPICIIMEDEKKTKIKNIEINELYISFCSTC